MSFMVSETLYQTLYLLAFSADSSISAKTLNNRIIYRVPLTDLAQNVNINYLGKFPEVNFSTYEVNKSFHHGKN